LGGGVSGVVEGRVGRSHMAAPESGAEPQAGTWRGKGLVVVLKVDTEKIPATLPGRALQTFVAISPTFVVFFWAERRGYIGSSPGGAVVETTNKLEQVAESLLRPVSVLTATRGRIPHPHNTRVEQP